MHLGRSQTTSNSPAGQGSSHPPDQASSQKLTDAIVDSSQEGTQEARAKPGVKRVLLAGVFWRILIIELILLAGSLAARAWLEDPGGWELFWYALRIMLLVAVIILFMWLTLSVFLKERPS